MPYSLMLAISSSVMGTDLYIAGMPQMVEQLSCTTQKVQWTITSSVIGGSIGTLFVGPISDFYGRYKLLILMQCLAGLAAIACGFATVVETVIGMRFLYGFMGAGANVITFAMLSETFERRRAATYMAYMTSMITFSLIIAPFLGGMIIKIYNWRGCFFILGLLNILTGLGVYMTSFETLKERKTFHLISVFKNYRKVLSDSIYLRLSLIPAFMM